MQRIKYHVQLAGVNSLLMIGNIHDPVLVVVDQ
ncbi:hypothetical protein SAMN05421813_10830 [Daejeonella rubra]|uniref:Uncharacterized protein n=1 Tax=Daejeonella rubra TaxID=990371 RepID=A0A1G9RJ58_9SPHI|nr:hypothetical protein SAMN05421813_10830 [Daejeonella rubra]